MDNSFVLTADVIAEAAIVGELETIKWLRENGCPWDNRTVVNAIYYGHFDLYHYGLANGLNKRKKIEHVE
jgi:hypothetical protein